MANTLQVAIYKAPSTVELAHWAIHARVGGVDMIYQVIGGDGEPFEYDENQTYPERSGSHANSITVSTNVTKSIDDVRKILTATKIDNSDQTYNCQKWVLEGLKDLYQNGAISDAEYKNGVDQLSPAAGKKGVKRKLFAC
jgi:Family of unknown function (DUF6540)